ncbi:MAG: ATP-dependent helicase [Pseudonocardia sp.]
MRYTTAQKAAIDCLDQPLLIVACAGSGKTQVLASRVVELLRRPDVHPRNIVAFTFTEKAAAELKDRTTTLVNQELGEVHGLAEMFVGTMHAYALDALHAHVPETFKYGVLNDIQTRLAIDRSSRKCGLASTVAMVNGAPRMLRRYVDSRLYMQVMNILREDEVDEAQLPESLVSALGMYRDQLHQHRYFDYTDLLKTAADLLEESPDDEMAGAFVRHVRDHVRYVVVDEYQDTNHVQERLIRALTRFGANLCVVGDDDQTIYQWRGSAVRNILTFAGRYDHVRTVTLDDNFRSSEGVVSLGRAIAEENADERLGKQMVAAGHQSYQRGDIIAKSLGDLDEEAGWIADRIEHLRGAEFVDAPGAEPRGLSWSDFAVLYRSVANDAGPLVAELKRRNIPYLIKGLTRLFEAPEIEACVASFRYINGSAGRAEVQSAWLDADLGLDNTDVSAGLHVLDAARDWRDGERWSSYNIQRTYLALLEAMGVREERVPSADGATRGELVFYNLGKFSQAISDFEEIYFQSDPQRKYEGFVGWLINQAPAYYAESDADVGYATPDAVTIATVHQAKGLQWPAVFVPALRRNRFPNPRQGGLNAFHVIPAEAVADADRYRSRVEDERRLFYVAVTRAQKWLALTWAPGTSNRARRASEFFDFATRNRYVLTAEPSGEPPRLQPQARHEIPDVSLSFSELKYLFECPYQFKLRFLYGFNPPIHEALGYGKSVHDALAEVHKRAIAGDLISPYEVETLVDRHLHVPFAYPELRAQLRRAALDAVTRYLRDNRDELPRTLYSEQQVQVHVAPGVTVDGRIDLIRRLDRDETSIVDFKSTERAQAEDVTRDQLHVYALGYQELTGERADLVEVLNLDQGSSDTRELVDEGLLLGIRDKIQKAGEALRSNTLPRLERWCSTCEKCDLRGVCRSKD